VSERDRWGRGGAEASVASFAAATATAGAVAVAVYPAYGTLTVETLAPDAAVAATPAVSDASTACAVSIGGAFSGDLGVGGTGSAYTLFEEETVVQSAGAESDTCRTQGGCR